MNASSPRILSTIAVFIVFLLITAAGFAQKSDTEDPPPRYNELLKYDEARELSMVAENTDRSHQVAHVDFTYRPNVNPVEGKVDKNALLDAYIWFPGPLSGTEAGLDARDLEDLEPVQFTSNSNEEGNGSFGIGIGGRCGIGGY